MKLSPEHIDFFETFGFLKFSGLLKDDIQWITDEFAQVFPMFEKTLKHDGSKRTMIVPFIDQREKLCALLDDPRIHGICTSLLGEDFNYMGSDGNYYSGETNWHADGINLKRRHIKIAIYLDKLNQSNGALRVIPGSHLHHDKFGNAMLKKTSKSQTFWGMKGSEIPAVVLDVEPGDLLLFHHQTIHSSWGGGSDRRMFTLNLCERFKQDELEELTAYVTQHAAYRRNRYYTPTMMETAGPQRMEHLEQVMSVDRDFDELTKHLTRID